MRGLIVLGAGGLAAWYGGDSAAQWLIERLGGPSEYMRLMGWFLAFFGGAIIAQILLNLRPQSAGGVRSGGFAMVARPLTGSVLSILAAGIPLLAIWFLIAWGLPGFFPDTPPREYETIVTYALLGSGGLWLLFYETQKTTYFRFIGGASAPFRRMLRVAGFGKGGSAAFAGLLSEWESLWRPGAVLLGQSAYGKKWKIGLKDDRHLLTIASPGGGKGRSAIIPNLLTWPGSALVIDPKGTNAAVTAARRGNGGGRVTKYFGQTVHVFDPFKVVAPLGIASSSFNPLALLDPDSERIAEDIWAISDSLVVMEQGAAHWDESAHSLISGVIAHIITTEPAASRTLGRVRDLLTDPLFMGSKKQIMEGVSIVGEMVRNNKAAAGLAAKAASQISAAGDQERGSILSTAQRHTKWLDSPPMRAVLSGSGFDLRDLKRTLMTVYVVIPPEELDNHKRFLRLFVTLGLAAMTRERAQPKHRVLFVIDEFPALGRLEAVQVGINVIRSYRVILWPIIQNLNQLVHLYQDSYQSFLDATGAVQVFSIGGQGTAKYVAEELGERLVDRKSRGQLITALAQLQTPGEAREQTDRDWSSQIVLRAGKTPMLLKRVMYDKDFKKSEYAPDPDHPEKGWTDVLGGGQKRLLGWSTGRAAR